MDAELKGKLRALPAVGELLERADLTAEPASPRWALVEAVREVISEVRSGVRAGGDLPAVEDIVARARNRARTLAAPRLTRVVNATGVVIHTNLGRAPLAAQAIERVVEVAGAYSNLEYDLEQGGRGSRHGIVDDILCRLTGAEAAMVVNNNAAAVLLALSVLAAGREVVVSRGELVEIGGSFRIPDILLQSGCRLVEVGTTNRTRIQDYERAVGPETALLLKVHPSNFRVVGFSESVDATALVALGRRKGLPVMEDLGSGCLVDLAPDGLPGEPTAARRVASGLDLVTMSGDKLLGGPQAGILLGKKEVIDACRRHPLARALRVDKLCLAALEGTLRVYLDGDGKRHIPVLAALTASPETLAARAERLKSRLEAQAPGLPVRLAQDDSRVGGGAFPGHSVPTTVVAVGQDRLATRLEAYLRSCRPPIVARLKEGALLLDPRTWVPGDIDRIATAIASFWAEYGHGRTGNGPHL